MAEQDIQDWYEYSTDLVTQLLEDGSNDEAYHVIEHHFSSTDFELLEKLAVSAFKLGYDVEEPEEAELETGEKVFAFDIVTEQLLDIDILHKEVKQMFDLAKTHHLDYDGWGTYFEE